MNNTSSAVSHNCQPRGKLIDDYFEFITIIITYGFTFFAGFIGNAIIIYIVFYFRKMKSVPNMFLANLAFADLLLILFCVPIKCAQLFSFTWQFGLVLCKLIHYIQNLSVINSVYTLTAISIERYFAILYPLKNLTACTEDKTKWIIIGIWILSFTIASPTIYFRTHYAVACGKFYCMLNYDNPLTKYFTLYQVVLILVIPTIILCYTYTAICMKLWYVLNTRSHLTGMSSEHSQYDHGPLPASEIEDPTCLNQETTLQNLTPTPTNSVNLTITHTSNKKKYSINSPLTTRTSPTGGECRIRFSASIESSPSSCKLTQINSSSLDFHAPSPVVKRNLVKPQTTETTLISMSNTDKTLERTDSKCTEDPNNNDDSKTDNGTADRRSALEMRALRKTTSCDSNGSNSPDKSQQPPNQPTQTENPKRKLYTVNRNSAKQFHRSVSEKSNDNTAKQIIKMLAIMVVIFILSWAPILIFNLCRGFSIIPRFNQGHLKEINTVFSLLSYINSCINPFVYGFMSRNFRNSFKTVFKQLFSCCFRPSASTPDPLTNRHRSINPKNPQALSICN